MFNTDESMLCTIACQASLCQLEVKSLRASDIYVSVNWPAFVSDNGLSPDRHQTIIGTHARILLIGPLGINFGEILIKIFIQENAFECVACSKLTIIAPDNGLSPGQRQAIIWTNARILLIGPQGTNFNNILIEIHIISFKKIHLKMSSGKRRPSVCRWQIQKHFLDWKYLNSGQNFIDLC